jgi:hypothetical protein
LAKNVINGFSVLDDQKLDVVNIYKSTLLSDEGCKNALSKTYAKIGKLLSGGEGWSKRLILSS